jgi:hypothetical protein
MALAGQGFIARVDNGATATLQRSKRFSFDTSGLG